MKSNFNKYFDGAATRDQAAAKVYASPEFLDLARERIKDGFIKSGDAVVVIGQETLGGFKPKRGDEKFMTSAIKTLKSEFPGLNDVYGTISGYLQLDTKPRSALRGFARSLVSFYTF